MGKIKRKEFDLHTKGLFSSSPSPPPFPTGLLFSLKWDFTCLGAILLLGLFSGNIFNMIPMAMSNSPVPCCSVNGFVNIKYDSNNVTAFLAVVICMPEQIKTQTFRYLYQVQYCNIYNAKICGVGLILNSPTAY